MIRPALEADRSAAVGTVLRAFVADPALRYFFPDDDEYARQGRVLFGYLFDARVEGGEVIVTDDCVAVSMWNPPGGNRLGNDLAEQWWDRDVRARLTPDEQRRIDAFGAALEPFSPKEPHWYLGVLATHPDWQARGLGRGVIAPILARADRAGVPVSLETALEASLGFYSRFAFRIAGETNVTGGPKVWTLIRPPR